MKVRFQADNDFKHAILYGVVRHEPVIDFQTAVQAQLFGLPDLEVLAQAAREGRLLVTHDRKTMHLVWAVSEAEEWQDRIAELPFR